MKEGQKKSPDFFVGRCYCFSQQKRSLRRKDNHVLKIIQSNCLHIFAQKKSPYAGRPLCLCAVIAYYDRTNPSITNPFFVVKRQKFLSKISLYRSIAYARKMC